MAEKIDFFDLQLDEDALRERQGDYVLIDQDVSLWWKRNRIGLVKISTQQHLAPDPSAGTVYDTLFRVIADADSDCHIDSLRLTLDFSATPQVTVQDMIPAEVLGREPVKIKSKTVKGRSFVADSLILGPSVSYEQSVESSVYFPEIRGLGVGFNKAVWSFEHLPGAPLYAVNKDLQLLLSAPSSLRELPIHGTLRIEIARKGWTRLLPLIGYKNTTISLPEHSLENEIQDAEGKDVYSKEPRTRKITSINFKDVNLIRQYWDEVAKDIEKQFEEHPSEWSESLVEDFVEKFMKEDLVNKMRENKQLEKELVGHENTDLRKFKTISPKAFKEIFKNRESGGKTYTKNIFAIYLGYLSYRDFVTKRLQIAVDKP